MSRPPPLAAVRPSANRPRVESNGLRAKGRAAVVGGEGGVPGSRARPATLPGQLRCTVRAAADRQGPLEGGPCAVGGRPQRPRRLGGLMWQPCVPVNSLHSWRRVGSVGLGLQGGSQLCSKVALLFKLQTQQAETMRCCCWRGQPYAMLGAGSRGDGSVSRAARRIWTDAERPKLVNLPSAVHCNPELWGDFSAMH